MPAEPQRIGAIIGSYEVLEELGRGGVGIVYRARHRLLGREVALKVLHDYWTADPEFLIRFQEEGRVMALLEHPNILRVYDAGETEGHFYLAMSFVPGRTVEQLIEAGVAQSEALAITRQMCDALDYAHERGVVHRDVKPTNIIVTEDGRAVLTDFGVARLLDSPTLTLPGMQVGTPFYMSPEQVRGEPVDGRTDIYSLGVVLYQMLTGDLPFPMADADEVLRAHLLLDPPPLPSSVPNWLAEVVMKAIAKAPQHRFDTAGEMRAALRAASDTPTPTAVQPVVSGTPSRPLGREPGRGEGRMVRRELTVLSLDIADSSRLKQPGETMAAQRQFGAFREYVREKLLEDACLDYTWAGDGLIALFEEPAQGAECALSIRRDLGAFNQEHRQTRQEVRLRIGVHSGTVLMSDAQPLGEITSATLDVAAHLQKDAPENAAAITETTYRALDDRSAWELLGATRNGQWYSYRNVDPTATGWRVSLHVPEASLGPQASPTAPLHEPRPLRLEISVGPHTATREILREAVIGRPDENHRPDINLTLDDAVSRRHARLFRESDGFQVEDLGSSNGTFLNGEQLAPREARRLAPGDVLELGEKTVIRVIDAP